MSDPTKQEKMSKEEKSLDKTLDDQASQDKLLHNKASQDKLLHDKASLDQTSDKQNYPDQSLEDLQSIEKDEDIISESEFTSGVYNNTFGYEPSDDELYDEYSEDNFFDQMEVDYEAKKNSLSKNDIFGDLDYMYLPQREIKPSVAKPVKPSEEKLVEPKKKKKKKNKKKKKVDKAKLYEDMGHMDDYDEYDF